MAKVLTDVAVRNAKGGTVRQEIPDGGQRGLYLIIQPNGSKSWAIRYRHHGVPRKMTLQAGLSLAAARKLAAEAMFQVAQGIDPARRGRPSASARSWPTRTPCRPSASDIRKSRARACGARGSATLS